MLVCAASFSAQEAGESFEATGPPPLSSLTEGLDAPRPEDIGPVEQAPPPARTTSSAPQAAEENPDDLAEFHVYYDAKTAENAAGAETGSTSPEGPREGPGALRMVAVLFLVCGGIIALGYGSRKLLRRTPLLAGQHFGTVLGKVYLSPRASLHYVRSGGRILVIGVTQSSMSLIAEFNEADFIEAAEDVPAPNESAPGTDFLELLQGRVAQAQGTAAAPPASDESLASLRGELERLQQHLKGSVREPEI